MASKKKIAPDAAPLKQSPFSALAGIGDALPKQEPKSAPPASTSSAAAPAWGPGKVVARRERKGRAGKTATRVTGLPEARLVELQKAMKKALGCGATIEGADLVLLGDVVDRAASWLRAQGAPRVVEGN